MAWKLHNQKSPSEAPDGITSRKSYKRPSAQTVIDVYFLYTYGPGARRKLAASVTYSSGSIQADVPAISRSKKKTTLKSTQGPKPLNRFWQTQNSELTLMQKLNSIQRCGWSGQINKLPPCLPFLWFLQIDEQTWANYDCNCNSTEITVYPSK